MKLNDWIIANLNNPDASIEDFQYLGDLTLDNTLLQSKDYYKNNKFINENPKFKNEEGVYSLKKFDEFYNTHTQTFLEFALQDQINLMEYGMFDINRPANAKVKDIEFTIGDRPNPQLNSIGIEYIGKITSSGKSNRELAQDSNIFDTASGKFLDKSLNDISLFSNPVEYFKSLFDEPLVYATYDEDVVEVDPITGNEIFHQKGEFKLNEDGLYYVETLNGRSLHGKQVVSALDYITSENSSWNKYDFFDSDDLQKSTAGIIAKNTAAVLPLFIPGLNKVYGGLLVARELGKAAPMLYGMVSAWTDQEDINNSFLNNLAGLMTKATTSSSNYALEKMFSFENFASLASDVATQWALQKAIAEAFSTISGGGKHAINAAKARAKNEYKKRALSLIQDVNDKKIDPKEAAKLIGTDDFNNITKTMIDTDNWQNTRYGMSALSKYIPKAERIVANRNAIGRNLSLGYMAIISNTDVYQTVLEKGGSADDAAWIALGSIAGMYGVNKFTGLGELFFEDDAAKIAYREAARKEAAALMNTAGVNLQSSVTQAGAMNLVKKGMDLGKNVVKNFSRLVKDKQLGIFGKAIGEGLEEVSEELVADTSKAIAETLGSMGIMFSKSDYGSFENAFERYTMSFLGGSLGGGIFGLTNKVKNRGSNDFQNDLIYLIRNNKKDEVIAEFDKMKKRGDLGSNSLSFKTSDDGKTYLTADNESESLANYIYNTLVKTVNLLDMILNGDLAKVSDDELFDHMVQGEYKAQALTDFLKGDSENVKYVSYASRYQEDFLKLAGDIVNKESEIHTLLNSTPDPHSRDAIFTEKLNKLTEEKNKLLELRDHLFGEGSLGYVKKTLYAIDPKLSGKHVPLNYNQFSRAYFGKNLEKLSEAERKTLAKKYESYKLQIKTNLDEAYELFRQVLEDTNSKLNEYKGISKSVYDKSVLASRELFPTNLLLKYDDKLEDEDEEEFNNRDVKLESESDEEFTKRKKERQDKINEYNRKNLKTFISKFADGSIDRSTFRLFVSQFKLNSKQLIDYLIDNLNFASEEVKNSIEENPYLSVLFDPNFKNELTHLLKTYNVSEDTEQILTESNSLIKKYIEKSLLSSFKDSNSHNLWDLSYDLFQDPVLPHTITNEDFYNLSKKLIDKNYFGIKDIDGVVQFLSDNYNWDFSSESLQGKLNLGAIDYFVKKSSGIEVSEDDGLNAIHLNEAVASREAEKESEQVYKVLQDSLYELIFDIVENDELIQSLFKLENTRTPSFLTDILDNITPESLGETKIEEFLDRIYELFISSENHSDFELTKDQLDTLKEIQSTLDMLESVVYAASRKSDFQGYVEHNKSINDFVKNHPKVFKNHTELTVLDEGDAPFILQEINQYQNEIKSWMNAHLNNSVNKSEKLIKADTALSQSRLDFFEKNKDAFKLSDEIDLLEGYDKLDLSSKDIKSLILVEELLHRNYQKAISNGLSTKLILEHIIPKIIESKEDLAKQSTSKLDEELTYGKLTSYDKFSIVVSNFAKNGVDFYSKLKEFIEKNPKIAPIAILEYAARLITANVENPEIVNEALLYLKEYTGLKIALLPNTSILLGVGGSGKTRASVKIVVGSGENTWLSGPTSKLSETLKEECPNGKEITIDEILKLGLGDDYSTICNHTTTNKEGKKVLNSKYWTKIKTLNGDSEVILNKSIKINKISDAPKYIVIDEATHISSPKLLILSQIAKENGINLILLGDNTQNGYSDLGFTYNLESDSLIAWRTPKLFVSLRDNNLQKMLNLRTLLNISNKCETADTEEQLRSIGYDLILDQFSNLSLLYYNEDEFYGELITETLPEDIIKKIKGRSIGFIGKESSVHYQKLKDAGIVSEVLDPTQVQGREFDYVIIDRDDWKCEINKTNYAQSAINIAYFIKDLYTMISRSREGTILIDNDLSKLVKNVKTTTTGKSQPISESIEIFKNIRLLLIEEILKIPEILNTLFKEETTPEVEPGSEETPDVDDGEDEEESGTEEEGGTESGKKHKLTEEEENDLNKILDVDYVPDEKSEKENNKKILEEQDPTTNQDIPVNIKTLTDIDIPIRVYANAHFSGVDYSQDVLINPDNKIKRDLGIFIKDGEVVKKGLDLHKKVLSLLQVKSILTYDFYDRRRINSDVNDLFSEDSFKNVKYFIKVEDYSPGHHHFIGNTSLDASKATISKNNKLITLVAKLKGNDGETYEITVGSLANPETWSKNETSIRESIKKRIDNDDPESESLNNYLSNLEGYITGYSEYINFISESNLEIELSEKPELSKMTTLIKLSHSLRLEDINSEYSPFDNENRYAVKSPIYVVTDDIPGVDESIKGKAVMYISNNTLLYPSELEEIYMLLKNDPENNNPQVRMIVLNNEGISFQSLYREKYKDIYTIHSGENVFTNPTHLRTTSIGMYASLWNFRANLIEFNILYNEWKSTNDDISDEEVERLCELDNLFYNELREKTGEKLIDENTYRNSLTEEQKLKVKIIWDFNDSLSEVCRLFRLGYNSKNGVYLRKLTNLTDKFYKNPDNVVGIYINPSLANTYQKVLDALFNNVINKIIEPKSDGKIIDPRIRMDVDRSKKWFLEHVTNERELHVTLVDNTKNTENLDSYETFGTIKLPSDADIDRISTVLIQIAKFLEIRGFNPETFDEYRKTRSEEDKSDKFKITLGDEELDYLSLVDNSVLDGGLRRTIDVSEIENVSEYNIPGIVEWKSGESGTMVVDKRIDNLFSLAFHGLLSTESPNNFMGKEIRATDAYYKYGIRIHPTLVKKEGEGSANAPVATNKKLFSANVTTGFPLITIRKPGINRSIDEKSKKPKKSIEKESIKEDEFIAKVVLFTENSGISVSKKIILKESKEKIILIINEKLHKKIVTTIKNGIRNININTLISKIDENFNPTLFVYEEFKEPIISLDWVEDVLTIELKSGDKYSIQVDGENIIINKVIETINNSDENVIEIESSENDYKDSISYNLLETKILKACSKLESFEDNSLKIFDLNDVVKILVENLGLINPNLQISHDTAIEKINKIQTYLSENILDDTIEGLPEAINSVNKELSEFKNSGCKF